MTWKSSISTLAVAATVALVALVASGRAGPDDPLPSWNDGPARAAILDFVRLTTDESSPQTYGIPPEQVVGSAGETKFGYDARGEPVLTKEPKLLLNNDKAGKPEGIHLMIGRRPVAAFGNSTGDRQMLEYAGAGSPAGARLCMLVLHDDAAREYAYGPALDLPDTKVGTFTQALYHEAQSEGWTVISMKRDWNRIFAFEP